MIIALHRPNRITVFAECLFCISTYACINNHRNRIDIQRECSYIIMIVAFIIESAFDSNKHTVLILHIAEFRFGIPSDVRHIMYRSGFRQIITAKQGLKRTESIIAHCSIRFPAIQQVCCKMHHFIAVYGFTETVNQQRIATAFCRSIGKVHYPAITNVRTGHIFSHPANHRFVKKRYLTTCTIGKDLKIVIEFSGSMSPVRCSLFASPVGFHEINELIYRLHGTINRFRQFLLIVFHQEETLQGVGVTPRIPVIDNFSRIPVESHPPHFIIIHIRVEDSFFDSFTHLQRYYGINLIERLTEEIVYPSQQSSITARTEVDNLFTEVGKRAFAALPG